MLPTTDRDERLQELEMQIQMGWGHVPGDRIPHNWREVPGPARTGAPVIVEVDGRWLKLDPIDAEQFTTCFSIKAEEIACAKSVLDQEKERRAVRAKRRTHAARARERYVPKALRQKALRERLASQ